MTQLLYNNDSYLKEFEASVLSCEETLYNGISAYDIVLDKSCFFPEQGGQECDKGILKSNNFSTDIIHVKIKDEIIHHICNKFLPIGETVTGCIDWNDRYDKMQQHSGEHLVSGTVHKLFGYDNVGFHLGATEVTLDFNGVFEESDIDRIEDIVNKAIYENFETVIFIPSAEELKSIDYRSKKELKGDVRIVEFPGYDICACCAPHVKQTGEIGMIKIVAAEHFKGGTRMWIKCGNRALKAYRSLLNDAKAISRLTSSKLEDITSSVSRLNESLKNSKYLNVQFEREIILNKSRAVSSMKNPIIFLENADNDNIRIAVNDLVSASEGYCAAFTGNDYNGYRFIIASSVKDCRNLINEMKACFEIKGGGTPDMVQGNIKASLNDIKKYWSEL